MTILTVTKHKASELHSFVPHESCTGQVNQLSNEGNAAECNSALYGLRTVFVCIEMREKTD